MERAYRHSTRVLGGLLAALGVAIVVVTVARGGGPLTVGVVFGTMLALVGAGRAMLAGRPGGNRGAA